MIDFNKDEYEKLTFVFYKKDYNKFITFSLAKVNFEKQYYSVEIIDIDKTFLDKLSVETMNNIDFDNKEYSLVEYYNLFNENEKNNFYDSFNDILG